MLRIQFNIARRGAYCLNELFYRLCRWKIELQNWDRVVIDAPCTKLQRETSTRELQKGNVGFFLICSLQKYVGDQKCSVMYVYNMLTSTFCSFYCTFIFTQYASFKEPPKGFQIQNISFILSLVCSWYILRILYSNPQTNKNPENRNVEGLLKSILHQTSALNPPRESVYIWMDRNTIFAENRINFKNVADGNVANSTEIKTTPIFPPCLIRKTP